MSTPLALAAVGALAAASQLAKRGSRSSENDKARIVDLVRTGRAYEARKLSESLGHERLDLSSGADLFGADLSEADLSEADLSGADLNGVFLHETTGIDLGPDRVFKGIPYRYRIQRSRLSNRDYGLVPIPDEY